MLRTAVLRCWLITCTLCLPGIVSAQGHAPATPPQRPAAAAQVAGAQAAEATPPALLELAQSDPDRLAERLQAIRGGTPSEYGTSSRRTANRNSATAAAPAAQAPIAPDAGSAFDTAQAPSGDASLPSVLVRRGNSNEQAAPITDATDLTTSTSTNSLDQDLGDAFGTSSEQGDSSRRTARRWRSQQTPTYQAPAAQIPPAAFPGSSFSSSSGTGASDLSLIQQGPTLRVETLGPKAIAVGKAATYRVRLVNAGSVAAQRVVVTATLPDSVQIVSAKSPVGSVDEATDPAGSRRIAWSMDQVSGGSQQELSIELKAVKNQPLDLKVDWMYRPASLAARIEVQQPLLAVDIDGPVEMRFGETKVFKIRLSNPGNGPAENVAVNIAATGANGQPNQIGTLAAGESRALELELTAKQAGTMQIRAVARGDGSLQAESAHEVRVRRAALAVEISAPGLIYAGTTASYKIRVVNSGDAVAEGVIMQVEMPTGATNGLGVDKQPITLEQPRWRIGDLGPGAERVYSMQCDLTVSGQNQLVARIQGTDDSAASDTALTTVESIADLKLIVNDPKGPVPVGQDVVYEIQVVNRGSKEATGIGLVAQFSEGVEPTAASGHAAEILSGQVVFEPITSIPAGDKVTVRITARAGMGGNLRFRAELNCSTPETKLVAEESTRFYGNATPASNSQSANRPSTEPTPAHR